MDWQEPTEEEKRAIRDSRDIPIIAVIKGLSCEDRKLIYDSIAVKSEYETDFMKTQEPWIEDFKTYWGENHHQDPSDSPEFGNDFVNSREYERFRLYYAAKHPDRIEIKHLNRRTLDFFVETEEFLRIENLILSTIK
ncbi:Uncharacterised protein [uncultured archaeon]|nr:Uncharacterised protein [uncultured archaeon]